LDFAENVGQGSNTNSTGNENKLKHRIKQVIEKIQTPFFTLPSFIKRKEISSF